MVARLIAIVALLLAGSLARPADARVGPQEPSAVDARGDAYYHFLMARSFEARGLPNEALVSLERAVELDPVGAEIRAELAALHARHGRVREALAAAHAALEVDADSRQAHRVLGTIYGALADAPPDAPDSLQAGRDVYMTRALFHLERALGEGAHDPAVQLSLGRLYTRAGEPRKAIPILARLIEIEGWAPDVALQLAQAYGADDRTAEAAALLEETLAREPQFHRALVLLGEVYERERRWSDAAAIYARAAVQDPASAELAVRRAVALLNGGEMAAARDVLRSVTAAHPDDANVFFLLAQVEREEGNLDAAEAAARHLMTLDASDLRGPYVLAEVFQQRRQHDEIVGLLAPLAETAANDRTSRLTGRLLVLLAGAYQQLDDHERAVATYARAVPVTPDRASGEVHLIQALMAAGRADEALAASQDARGRYEDDLRFLRLEAEALQRAERSAEAVSLLERAVRNHGDDLLSWVALSDLYVDLGRFDDAGRVLGSAEDRFPDSAMVAFKIGAWHDHQQRFTDAERAFRRALARNPRHAPALNHLGYMLAERGDRLEESVELIERALEVDPHNGAYLDSLGWAYFKLDRLELAERYLRLAAGQLRSSSIVHDHLGDVLFQRGAHREAVSAWEDALAGDGVSIDRDAVEGKIRRARQEAGGR